MFWGGEDIARRALLHHFPVRNAIAGGGTLISFPTLVWMGRNPILANATNSVALWPASLAGAVGFRRDLAQVRRWLFLLTIPSLIKARDRHGNVLGVKVKNRRYFAKRTTSSPCLLVGVSRKLALN